MNSKSFKILTPQTDCEDSIPNKMRLRWKQAFITTQCICMCIERVQQLVLHESEYNSFHFGELYASRLFASTPIEKER